MRVDLEIVYKSAPQTPSPPGRFYTLPVSSMSKDSRVGQESKQLVIGAVQSLTDLVDRVGQRASGKGDADDVAEKRPDRRVGACNRPS